MLKNLSKLFLLAIFQISPQQAFSEDHVSTAEIIKEIEKSLIFDKESREKIDFYQQENSDKKSDITINSSNSTNSDSEKKSSMNMVVVNPKSDNFDIRAKEKLAYNTVLIGQYEVAIELYKQILFVEPNNLYAKFSLAAVYQKIGQFRQAKTLYHQLLKDGPENQDEIVGNLLAILIEESPRDAVYLLSRLTTQNPKSSNVLAQAAIAYDKIKSFDQAISLLQKAITIDPENVSYKYNLAVIYDKTSQFDKALEMYADVVKNHSDQNQSVPLDQVKKRIESIKNKS